jgi:hypothetical protein
MSLGGTLARKGAAVTYSYLSAGTYDPATDTTTGDSVVTLTGHLMQIDGDPEAYAALGLVQSENPTHLFRPTTVGQMPPLGATVVFGGETLTVKDVEPLAMNGTKTAARIRHSR